MREQEVNVVRELESSSECRRELERLKKLSNYSNLYRKHKK